MRGGSIWGPFLLDEPPALSLEDSTSFITARAVAPGIRLSSVGGSKQPLGMVHQRTMTPPRITRHARCVDNRSAYFSPPRPFAFDLPPPGIAASKSLPCAPPSSSGVKVSWEQDHTHAQDDPSCQRLGTGRLATASSCAAATTSCTSSHLPSLQGGSLPVLVLDLSQEGAASEGAMSPYYSPLHDAARVRLKTLRT